MKKILFFLAMCLSVSIVCAQPDGGSDGDGEEIPIEVGYIDPTDPITPLPKAPIRIPSLSICGCTLFFSGSHADYTLQVISDDEQVVFETYVPYSVSTVSLPASLSGSYEIRLVPDTYYFFRGFIIL